MSKRNPTENIRVPGTHITVLVTEDGTARITRLGTTHTLTEPDTATVQAAVAAWITQHVAQVEDRPIPVTITDTAGRWHVLIHPDGTVTASEHGKDKPTPASRARTQHEDPLHDQGGPARSTFTRGGGPSPDRALPDAATNRQAAPAVSHGDIKPSEPNQAAQDPAEHSHVSESEPDRAWDSLTSPADSDIADQDRADLESHSAEFDPTQPSRPDPDPEQPTRPELTDATQPARADTHCRHAAPSRSFLTNSTTVDPAQHGWRGFLARLGIRVSPSAAELSEREDTRAISQHWPGPRTIAVVNGKGGAAKTTTTALLAAFYARYGGAGVIAFDNNETRGTLGWRTEQGPHEGHVHDLLPHAEELLSPTARAADLAAYMHHQTQDRYDVLRSNPDLIAAEQRITQADYDSIQRLAEKYYRLIFVDSGNDESAPRWLSMVDHADQLVVPTTTRLDHAEAARLLLDALRNRDERSATLADGAVVIVTQADRQAKDTATIAAGFQGLARAAVTVPYDPALTHNWLRLDALSPGSHRAWLSASAQIARGL